jgi:tetratricopeptide (TPR) repeat protein
MGPMDLKGLQLGGFVLDAPLARGAMGEVWRATHAETGLKAAVKVVGAATPQLAAALQREIRASAALSDPRIVQLYDAGELPEPTRGLQAGVPWLAMELLEGGVLSSRRLGWPEARRVLEDLLAALAHAHARGLLHRDLKPDNVMFDAAGGTRLVDFGIGVRIDEGGRIRPSGTPTWMAPEQFERDGRHLGPWTDLYAVGCIAFWMASGAPPFHGDTIPAMRRAHTEEPLPPLRPTFAVPDGFAAWVARLTAKSPRDRFRRAADARAALEALPEPEVTGPVRRHAPPAETLVPSAWTLETMDAPTATAEAPRPLPPAAAGLGLVRLREAPLMGRSAEQAQLMRLFERSASGEPQLVVVSGPSGSGKTRLVTWLCREVHASGRGTPFRAAHAPEHGDGLAGLVSRALRIDAADPAGIVRERIDEEGLPSAYTLAEIVRPSAGGLGAPLERRCETVADALRHLSESRVPVVWIDDAQWSPEGVALARQLAGRKEPWLVILTTRSALDLPGAVVLELGSLDDADAAELAAGMASIDAATRAALVRHAQGSPLFLVELLGEWVGRGLLEVSPAGWRLARDGEAWPADLPALWRSRLLRVLARGGHWLGPLAIAAALGAEVEAGELERACAIEGFAAPGDAVAVLFGERLATPDPAFQGRRWSFVHPSLREAVLALADERALLEAAHRACAAMLVAGAPATEERRAAHLEAAGDVAAAVDALLAARTWQSRRDLDAATRIADRVEALLERIPGDEHRRGELLVARARIAMMRGKPDEAVAWAEKALASSDAHARAVALVDRGRARRFLGQPEPALGDLLAAVEALTALGDQEQRAVALGEVGISYREEQRYEEADAALSAAVASTSEPVRRVELETLRAGAMIMQGRAAEAIESLDRLAPTLANPDFLFPRASWLYHRAFARAQLGAWVGAEADMREAVALRYRIGSRAGSWVETWAAMLAMQERFDEAEAAMSMYEIDWEDLRFDLVRASIAASRGDWDEVRRTIRAPTAGGPAPGIPNGMLDGIAERAEAAGLHDLAAQARSMKLTE